jgi:hypothetical protein
MELFDPHVLCVLCDERKPWRSSPDLSSNDPSTQPMVLALSAPGGSVYPRACLFDCAEAQEPRSV